MDQEINDRGKIKKDVSAKHHNCQPLPKSLEINDEDLDIQDDQLLAYDQVPKWLRASIYLTVGYRPGNTGCCHVTGSAFSLHNETVNIWTHAIPIIVLPIYSYHLVTNLISEYNLNKSN